MLLIRDKSWTVTVPPAVVSVLKVKRVYTPASYHTYEEYTDFMLSKKLKYESLKLDDITVVYNISFTYYYN